MRVYEAAIFFDIILIVIISIVNIYSIKMWGIESVNSFGPKN